MAIVSIILSLLNLVLAILTLFFNRTLDYMWQPLRVDHKMKHLRKAMEDLKVKHIDVKDQIWQAELEERTPTNEVKRWLEKVKSIEDEVIDVENENFWWRSNYGVLYSYLILWERYSIGYKVVDKLREITKLYNQGAFKDVATKLSLPVAQELPSTSTRAKVMDYNRDEILEHLIDNKVKSIGIWGMGGVGKTTLLKEINNYFASSHLQSFDRVIFIVASKGCKPEELQKKICKSLGLLSEEDDDMTSRATHLFNLVKQKNVLLLLDDLWKYVNLVDLGFPLGQDRCKVVFTTRLFEVCGSMEADRKLKIVLWNQKEAWDLFEEKVGKDTINKDPRIRSLAEKVANKCCGLPLALVTIGKAMSSKQTWKEWKYALNLLCSSRPYEISDISEKMLSLLEYSYENLQDDTVKQCFLSCSMWSEDYMFQKDYLIMCWMGLGLIHNYKEINEAFDKGHFIIENLVSACLLECDQVRDGLGNCVEDYVRMHDVLRDLAIWISTDHGTNKDKWIVEAHLGLTDCQAEKWEKLERISLMHNNIKSLPEQFPMCQRLSILLLNGNRFLSSIPQGLFDCLRSLRYLDLQGTSIKELPKEVSSLVNLEFLNLCHTEISNLPNVFNKLVKLKYLLLEGTRMDSRAWGIVAGLPQLKVLDVFNCWGTLHMESQGGLEALEHLDGRLMDLGIDICTISAVNNLSKFSTIFTFKLRVHNLEATEFLDLFSPALSSSKPTMDSLQCLQIEHCSSLKELVVGGAPRLEKLSLESLIQLERIVAKEVTPIEFLPSLCALMISNCHRIKNISWVSQLPNLNSLVVHQCSELETLTGNEKDAFPRLISLLLSGLPKLDSICSSTIPFPSLDNLAITDCPELKKLPFKESNFPENLRTITCSKEWWEHLEWEDGNTKLSLQEHQKNGEDDFKDEGNVIWFPTMFSDVFRLP